MNGFLGEYEATLDPKGRFLLPAGFKKQLPEGETASFVINRGFEKCLTLYPLSSWQPIFDKVNSLPDFDPKIRQFRRVFLNGAIEVQVDSAGRILLPQGLKEHAGLQKDIVIASAGDKMEIWDKAKYKEFFESISATEFSDLAKEVMGYM